MPSETIHTRAIHPIRTLTLRPLLAMAWHYAPVRPGPFLQIERSNFPAEWFITLGSWFIAVHFPLAKPRLPMA